jgi:L-arabinose isomerase
MLPEPSLADLEVWLLTGSQSLYGSETLRQVAEQSSAIAAALDSAASVPVRVVGKPVVTEPTQYEGSSNRPTRTTAS